MLKFLLVLLGIVFVFYLIFVLLKRMAKNFIFKNFGININQKDVEQQYQQNKKEEVLYNKNDVVVLKGEAKKEEEDLK